MKLKKTLILVALSALLFLGFSILNANASSWKKGVPDSINSPITQPWISNKKSGTWSDKGNHGYSLYVLITNDQIAGSTRNYYSNGKPYDNNTYWSQTFSDPYYKTIGKSTYVFKNKVAAKFGIQQVKIEQISSNKLKAWYKYKSGNFVYFGVYTKHNTNIYANINHS